MYAVQFAWYLDYREAFEVFDKGTDSIVLNQVGDLIRALGETPTELDVIKVLGNPTQKGNMIEVVCVFCTSYHHHETHACFLFYKLYICTSLTIIFCVFLIFLTSLFAPYPTASFLLSFILLLILPQNSEIASPSSTELVMIKQLIMKQENACERSVKIQPMPMS